MEQNNLEKENAASIPPINPMPEKRPNKYLLIFVWILRKINNLIWGILRFLVVLWLLFKLPLVQNWLAQRAATFLSNELNAKIEVGYVELEFFNKAILKDVYIEDQNGDTLLHAKQLRAYIDLISITQNHINVNRIELRDAYLNYQRIANEKDFNLYFLLNYFAGTKKTKDPNKRGLKLSITEARLLNTRFHYMDAAAGTELNVQAKHAYIFAPNDSMNIPKKFIRADSVFLDSATIEVIRFQNTPLPQTVSVSIETTSTGKDTIIVHQGDAPAPSWDIRAERMRTRGVVFKLKNTLAKPAPERDLDFNDLQVQDINLSVDKFSMYQGDFKGNVRHLSAREARGFNVLSLRGNAFVNSQRVHITDLRLKTPYSDIGDFLSFEYEHYTDFYDFVNKVKMQASFHNSTIALRDIIAFAYPLKEIDFFSTNANVPISISGSANGIINNLRIRNIDLRVGSHTIIKGNMSLNDVTVNDAGFMDLQFEELQTSYTDLVPLLSFIKLPTELQRLGLMHFKGNYTGYFKDFVAFGDLRTSVGAATMDLKMNLRQGMQNAKYSGNVQLQNFDLGTVLANPNFGKMGLHTQINGSGLTLASLNTAFRGGKVDSFTFKNYIYRDILLDAQIQNYLFDGNLVINDANLEVEVKGIADLRDTLPKIDLEGHVRYADFKSLNISEEFSTFKIDSFRIQATGDKIAELKGKAFFNDINIVRLGKHVFIDSFLLVSEDSMRWRTRRIPGDSIRRDTLGLEKRNYIKVFSDLGTLRLAGAYDMKNLPKSMARYIQSYYPNLFKTLENIEALQMAKLVQVDSLNPIVHQRFRLQLNIDTTYNFTQLIDTNFHSISRLSARAFFNSLDDTLNIETKVGALEYGNIYLADVNINGIGLQENLHLVNSFKTLRIGDSTFLPSFNFDLLAKGDTLKFATSLGELGKVASNINLAGKLSFTEKVLEINLDTANLSLLNKPWSISGDNYIRIGSNRIEAKNVRFSNEEQLIQINTLGENGLHAHAENVNLKWLYDLAPIPQIKLDGSFSAEVYMQDIFKQKDLSADIVIDRLFIDNHSKDTVNNKHLDNWGKTTIHLATPSLKDPIQATLVHHSEIIDSFNAKVKYTPFWAVEDANKKNHLDIKYNIQRAKTSMLNYFLTGVLSNITGHMSVKDGSIEGQIGKQVKMGGMGYVYNFGMMVDFLNTSYKIDSASVLFRDRGFFIVPYTTVMNALPTLPSVGAAGGSSQNIRPSVPIKDEKGQLAQLRGGIRHTNLNDFNLDLQFILKNNLVLNTAKGSNPMFYGTVYADGLVSMQGPFNNLKLTIDDAVTRENSFLVLPLDGPVDVDAKPFVDFVDKVQQRADSLLASQDGTNIPKISAGGFSLEINTRITEAARMQMVFDERTGEIMEGRGVGNLRLSYSADGVFGMDGSIEIKEGSYLFTYQNILNKEFTLSNRYKNRITWNGDPTDAVLDIKAEYRQKVSGLSNLISASSFDNDTYNSITRSAVDVSLGMNLKGQLFKPDLSFEISFPSLSTDVQAKVNPILNALQQNPNELNRQVFGLLALKQFLPSENSNNGGNIDFLSGSVNTIGELVSRNLSNYLTDLLGKMLSNQDVISGLEFDFGVMLQDKNTTDISSARNSSVQFGVDQMLFGRVRLYLGANVDIGNNNMGNLNGNTQGQVGSDFRLEVNLTPDGRFKATGYNRTENNLLGRINRSGIGISFSKDFRSFRQLFKDMKENRIAKRARRKEKRAQRNAPIEQVQLPPKPIEIEAEDLRLKDVPKTESTQPKVIEDKTNFIFKNNTIVPDSKEKKSDEKID